MHEAIDCGIFHLLMALHNVPQIHHNELRLAFVAVQWDVTRYFAEIDEDILATTLGGNTRQWSAVHLFCKIVDERRYHFNDASVARNLLAQFNAL